MEGSKCRSFSKQIRAGVMEGLKEKGKYIIKVLTPGVGSYRLPSEFGYYENKK
jgi:hypothetical protein